jgi:hypothetical protein
MTLSSKENNYFLFFLQFIWVGEESQLLKDSSEEVRLTY